MSKIAYLLKGANMPPKLAVVAFDLEPDYLLEITNRFLKQGDRYTSLTPIHGGIVKLADALYDAHDQAYFPGYEDVTVESEGGTNIRESDGKPGRLLAAPEPVTDSCRVFLVARTSAAGLERWAVVVPDEEKFSAQALADTFSQLPGKMTIRCQYIGSGTFSVDPDIVAKGFSLKVGPVIVCENA